MCTYPVMLEVPGYNSWTKWDNGILQSTSVSTLYEDRTHHQIYTTELNTLKDYSERSNCNCNFVIDHSYDASSEHRCKKVAPENKNYVLKSLIQNVVDN